MSSGSLLNKGLPYDYEVEYIEGTGTQWIDTGIKTSNIKTLSVSFMAFETGPYSTLLGARNGDTDDGSLQVRIGKASGSSGKTIMIGRENYIPLNVLYSTKYNLYINVDSHYYVLNNRQTLVSKYASVTTPYNLPLFGLTTTGITVVSILKARIFDLVINGKHFIPVKKGSDGYLWDGEKLYGNSGTDSFIVGPRVS